MIVGSDLVRGVLAAAVGVQIFRQVVLLGLHVGTHLVERRGRNHVALAIDLPCDGRVGGADGIGTRRSGGGASVDGKVASKVTIDDHTTHEVGTEVGLVVDDNKDLALDTDIVGNILCL